MKLDPDQLKFAGLGVASFVVLYGLYLLGAAAGATEMDAQLQPTIRALTIENNDLRGQLTQLELKQVQQCAVKASEAVMDCEQLCALEVSQALEGCTLLLCGEVKEAP